MLLFGSNATVKTKAACFAVPRHVSIVIISRASAGCRCLVNVSGGLKEWPLSADV